MAYELCPECRVNKVPRGYYVCDECKERLAREEFEPSPEPERRPFWKRGPTGPIIVSEQFDDLRPTFMHRVGQVIRYIIVAALIGVTGIFVVDMFHHPVHAQQLQTPDFLQHMADRAHAIAQELISALSNK
jgi:hypothetical protein